MLVATGKRHVLFLQGPGSLFFYRFGQALKRTGVEVSKIHLCAGDLLFWPSSEGVVFRGSFDDWPSFIERYIISHGVSDLVLFSDSRPYHRVATNVAKGLGLNAFVFENGYFRPDWITFERGGVNGRSPFPRDKAGIERLAAKLVGEPDVLAQPVRHNRRLVAGDWLWHGVNYLGTPVFPHYRRHRLPHPLAEVFGWFRKLAGLRRKYTLARRQLETLVAEDRPFFFFPLQLDHDFQLSVDSPFRSISHACDVVIGSFARSAPVEARLLVKNHPHDNNLVDRERDVAEIARRHGVSDRVVFIEAGQNPRILEAARGMVTINSTMGTSALHHGLPVCALGRAVYNVEGLTHQGGLDSFWQQPTEPDLEFFKTFRRALIQAAQVRGEFGGGKVGDAVFQECLFRLFVTPYRTAGLSLSGTAKSAARDRTEPAGIEIAGVSRPAV